MKYSLLLLSLFLSGHCFCQKEGMQWLLGGTEFPDTNLCLMDFSTPEPTIRKVGGSIGFLANSVLCDSSGYFRLFTNGVKIYNRDFIQIEGASDMQSLDTSIFNLGLRNYGSSILLPINEEESIYVSGNIERGNLPVFFGDKFTTILRYSILRSYKKLDRVLASKHNSIDHRGDTLEPASLYAVRHANGRDWWLTAQQKFSKDIYLFIIENGVPRLHSIQDVGTGDGSGLSQGNFSPNGNWFGVFSYWGYVPSPLFSHIYLYQFDRCSGLFSQPLIKRLPDPARFGGVSFLPNNQLMYVSYTDTIYQYQLDAPDIFASQTVVAEYDGFRDEFGNYTNFGIAQIAPNNRIYISPFFGLSHLHYIKYPDSIGLACQVKQHGIKTPIEMRSISLPNIPEYRLGKLVGSPCDTIKVDTSIIKDTMFVPPPEALTFQLTPNPTKNNLTLSILPLGLDYACKVTVWNMLGTRESLIYVNQFNPKVVLPFDRLESGIFIVRIESLSGEVLHQQKILKLD
jgi:hypothetical protein